MGFSPMKKAEIGVGKYIIMLIGFISICIYSSITLFINNIHLVEFISIIRPLLLFFAIGVVLLTVFSLLFQSLVKSILCTDFYMLVFTFFGIIDKRISSIVYIKYWHTLFISLVILGHIAYFIKRFFSINVTYILTLLISISFIALNTINISVGYLGVTIKPPEGVEHNTSEQIQPIFSGKNLPNVYYFIFDEMSSFSVAEEYFGVDNNSFLKSLEKKGFTIFHDSFNEVAETRSVIANYLSLEYKAVNIDITNIDVAALTELSQQSELIKTAESIGYKINTLGDAEMFYSIKNKDKTYYEVTSINGETISDIILEKSLFYPIIQKKLNVPYTKKKLEEIELYFNNERAYNEYNSFIFTYVTFPHQPFQLDRNGNTASWQDWTNWTSPKPYREQYLYACKYIDLLTSRIIENDKDAVIIIQSDHGPRGLYDPINEEMIIPYNERCHIFNAVYYRGETVPDCSGKSGVNTLRTIFSELWDLNLPDLEVPYNSLYLEAIDDTGK